MPTTQQIDKAFTLIAKGYAAYDYFFSKLDDPSWIEPLFERGLFSDPPRAARNDDNEVIGASWWPQSQYLLRVTPKAPEDVLCVMSKIGTDNPFIMSDFTKAALSMPVESAAKWAVRMVEWLRGDNAMFGVLENDIGQLASKLAKEGKPDLGLRLAAEVLAVLPDPEADKKMHPKDNAEKSAYSFLEPQIRCEKYNYEQILEKNIPDLADAAPFETMELLCGLLKKATDYSVSEPDEKQYDMSSVNRPAIEDSDQNYDFYFQHNLINALRDVAVKICSDTPDKLRELVEKLESYGWNIFQRLALYLLQVADNPPMDMVEQRLVNEKLFDYVGVHHEYFHLMKKRLGCLSEGGRQKILEWIDTAEKLTERDDLTLEEKEQLRPYWQYRYLCAIQDFLSGDRKEEFIKLKKKFGNAEIPPDFNAWHGGITSVGPRSPKRPEELSEMSMDELIQYLKDWKPSDEWKAPTPDGLGATLGSLVEKEPDKYANEIERFMDNGIDPTYVRHVMSAFCRVIESGKTFPFSRVFKLCKWIVDQPMKIPGRVVPEELKKDFEIDADWDNTRMEIARLFETFFRDKVQLPFELRNEAWEIIEPLTEDPDPDIEREEKYGDAMDLSLNSIRGKALYDVMYYAMWVCKHIKETENRDPHFDDVELRRVRDVLDKHLDIANEKYGRCRTDRAVYGQWLPQLVHVDTEWVKNNIGKIFPAEEDHRLLRNAVWNTYLLYSKLYNQVYDVLQGVYRQEVEALAGKKIEKDSYKTPEKRLAEHVVIMCIRGYIGLENGSLVDIFFKTAPDELTYHAMDFVGRSLTGAALPEGNLVEKLKLLWDWRVESVGGYDKMPLKELSTFGWWFSYGYCGDKWAFPRLEETLKRVGISRSNLYLFEHMSKVFKDYPSESLRCLRLFIDKNTDPWFFLGHSKESVWELLKQAVNHDDAEIRDEAEDIVHLLGSKGYLEYRKLLKQHRTFKGEI